VHDLSQLKLINADECGFPPSPSFKVQSLDEYYYDKSIVSWDVCDYVKNSPYVSTYSTIGSLTFTLDVYDNQIDITADLKDVSKTVDKVICDKNYTCRVYEKYQRDIYTYIAQTSINYVIPIESIISKSNEFKVTFSNFTTMSLNGYQIDDLRFIISFYDFDEPILPKNVIIPNENDLWDVLVSITMVISIVTFLTVCILLAYTIFKLKKLERKQDVDYINLSSMVGTKNGDTLNLIDDNDSV